jgi:hypothetical protein
MDQAGVQSVFDVAMLGGGKEDRGFQVEYRPDVLGGVVVLRHRGVMLDPLNSAQLLYAPLRAETRHPRGEVDLTFIPYYAWANRGPSAMRVWVPYFSSSGGLSSALQTRESGQAGLSGHAEPKPPTP